jgi:hypothetical protein
MADADITAMGGTIKCNQYSMGVNEKITGSSYNLYYAVNPVSLPSENVSVVLPLVKFIEGEYSYTMTSVTTVKAV